MLVKNAPTFGTKIEPQKQLRRKGLMSCYRLSWIRIVSLRFTPFAQLLAICSSALFQQRPDGVFRRPRHAKQKKNLCLGPVEEDWSADAVACCFKWWIFGLKASLPLQEPFLRARRADSSGHNSGASGSTSGQVQDHCSSSIPPACWN